MSQENVEIVRRVWEAWERGDLTGWLELMSDDLVSRRHAGLDKTTDHGKEGFLEQAAEWSEGFAGWSATAEEFIDAGEQVVVRNRHTGSGEASGIPIEMDFWFVHEVNDGKVVRVDMFVNEREALEAAGLSEYAMPADATEPVRRAVDALNQADVEGFTAYLHPQVEWEENSAAFPGLAGVYRGTAEVLNWAEQAVEEFWSELHMEVEELVEVDAGRVLLGIAITARGAASGVPTERRAWQAFWIDDGQIVKRTGPFWTREPALAALTE